MAKPGRTGQHAIVRNMQKYEWGDNFFFNLLIFVNFDIFATHILRNFMKKWNYLFKVI